MPKSTKGNEVKSELGPMKLLPCGKCWHVRYCDAFSEWYCARYHTFLGHSISPHKSHECDIIGTNGDIRTLTALWRMIV